MKISHYRCAVCLILLVSCLEFVTGCHAKSADSGNGAVTPQQKAAYDAHKRQAEYDQTGR